MRALQFLVNGVDLGNTRRLVAGVGRPRSCASDRACGVTAFTTR